MDQSTRTEVKLIVELTATQLELRTEKALNDLRNEIQVTLPKAIAHEIESCKMAHQKMTAESAKSFRWRLQTLISIVAVGISLGSLAIAFFR